MRILKTLVAAGAIAATATALAVVPASAEPINPFTGKTVTPNAWDVVAVGSQSITYLFGQLTYNYDKSVGPKDTPAKPYLYSWDAVPPNNLNNTMQQIVVKKGCPTMTRPNGSGAGIGALTSTGNTSYISGGKKHVVPCIDYARSSRPRGTTDPPAAPGGVNFVTLARDAVTYATASTTNAPNNLSRNQLAAIFGCTVKGAHGDPANTWGALLGSKAKPGTAKVKFNPILPQAGSGTLSFFAETALGLTSTAEPGCGSAAGIIDPTKQPEENEGTNKIFLKAGKPDPNVLYPYSIGAYLSQSQRSPKCGHKPTGTQNRFGCNQTGVLVLRGISGVAPAVGKKGHQVTNPQWGKTVFQRFLYAVTRWESSAANEHMPAYLLKYLGPKGYICKQGAVFRAYGFETTPACGA